MYQKGYVVRSRTSSVEVGPDNYGNIYGSTSEYYLVVVPNVDQFMSDLNGNLGMNNGMGGNSGGSSGGNSGNIISNSLSSVVSYIDRHTSLTHSASILGKGLTWEDNRDQGQVTLKAFELIGAGISINIGSLPGKDEVVASWDVGLGKYLGVSFFTTSDQYGRYDKGGLSINLGLGLATPITIGGTFPEGVEPRFF